MSNGVRSVLAVIQEIFCQSRFLKGRSCLAAPASLFQILFELPVSANFYGFVLQVRVSIFNYGRHMLENNRLALS
jgi:hypothetical protein